MRKFFEESIPGKVLVYTLLLLVVSVFGPAPQRAAAAYDLGGIANDVSQIKQQVSVLQGMLAGTANNAGYIRYTQLPEHRSTLQWAGDEAKRAAINTFTLIDKSDDTGSRLKLVEKHAANSDSRTLIMERTTLPTIINKLNAANESISVMRGQLSGLDADGIKSVNQGIGGLSTDLTSVKGDLLKELDQIKQAVKNTMGPGGGADPVLTAAIVQLLEVSNNTYALLARSLCGEAALSPEAQCHVETVKEQTRQIGGDIKGIKDKFSEFENVGISAGGNKDVSEKLQRILDKMDGIHDTMRGTGDGEWDFTQPVHNRLTQWTDLYRVVKAAFQADVGCSAGPELKLPYLNVVSRPLDTCQIPADVAAKVRTFTGAGIIVVACINAIFSILAGFSYTRTIV